MAAPDRRHWEMNEIPEFQAAVSYFRRFLAGQGYSDQLLWVFREDLLFRSPNQVIMRFPLPSENVFIAEKVYGEGRKQGLVQILAVAAYGDQVAATVWFPKFPEEEIQGWSQGLKLSIRQPFPAGAAVGGLGWWIVQCNPSYRRYQRFERFIASRRWATFWPIVGPVGG